MMMSEYIRKHMGPNAKTELRGETDDTTPTTKIMHLLLDKHASFPLFENLVMGLDGPLFQQIVCYLSGSGNEATPLEKHGYTVINLGMPRRKLKHYRPTLIFQIARIIEKYDIDIVHCQRHKPTVYGTLAAWLAKKNVKVVTTVHGRDRTRTLSRKLLNRILFRRVSRILTVSRAVRDDVLITNVGLPVRKVVTVYNGIDARRFSDTELTVSEARERLGLPTDGVLIFGTVARLAKVKGQTVLLQAYLKIRDQFPNSLLVLAGAGPLERELRERASALKIENHVVFLGRRSDIPQVLRAYDVFILPSLSEGHPLSLLEAMASGIPVIATSVGGVPEILANGSPGIMIPPSAADELATAMEQLAKMNHRQREAIGRQLRGRVLAEFTKEKMAAATAAQYLEVMSQSIP